MFDERTSERSTSRRQFLRHAGIAAGLITLARPALAQAKLRDVTLRLDWLFQGPNGGFMVAQDKGFYRDVGLNVDIGPRIFCVLLVHYQDACVTKDGLQLPPP